MRQSAFVVLAMAMLGLVGCGGSSYSTSPTQTTNLVTNGTFSATINGTSWSALGKVVVNRPTANSVALFAVSTTYGFSIALLNVTGPATISLVSAPSNGSQAAVSRSGQGGWSTGQTGGTGSFVITALTATRIAGTFSFDAPSIASTGSSGTAHITSGTFDLTF